MVVTRDYLRQNLQSVGFTYRVARNLVTVIFNVLTDALKNNEKIELPFGTLTAHRPTPKRAYRFGKIVKIHTKLKVHFRRKDQCQTTAYKPIPGQGPDYLIKK